MSRSRKERERMARRAAYQEAQRAKANPREARIINRAVGILKAYRERHGITLRPGHKEVQGAEAAANVIDDPLLAGLTQEQRDYICDLVISVELTGTLYECDEDAFVLQNNRCYENARDITAADKAGRVAYVEGVVECFNDGHLTHHAWNEIDGHPFDVTAVINQKVHDSDWSKAVYQGVTVTREQLAERERRRKIALERMGAWLKEHEEIVKPTWKAFWGRYKDEMDEMGLGRDDNGTVFETICNSLGEPTSDDIHNSYFTLAEMAQRFGYEYERQWVIDWTRERLAGLSAEGEMQRELVMPEPALAAATVGAA